MNNNNGEKKVYPSLNVLVLELFVTADPELQTINGKSKVSLPVGYESGSGPEYLRLETWEGRADFVAKTFSKGDRLVVHGKLSVRNYQDKNGAQRTAVGVKVTDIVPVRVKKWNNSTAAEETPEPEFQEEIPF